MKDKSQIVNPNLLIVVLIPKRFRTNYTKQCPSSGSCNIHKPRKVLALNVIYIHQNYYLSVQSFESLNRCIFWQCTVVIEIISQLIHRNSYLVQNGISIHFRFYCVFAVILLGDMRRRQTLQNRFRIFSIEFQYNMLLFPSVHKLNPFSDLIFFEAV